MSFNSSFKETPRSQKHDLYEFQSPNFMDHSQQFSKASHFYHQENSAKSIQTGSIRIPDIQSEKMMLEQNQLADQNDNFGQIQDNFNDLLEMLVTEEKKISQIQEKFKQRSKEDVRTTKNSDEILSRISNSFSSPQNKLKISQIINPELYNQQYNHLMMQSSFESEQPHPLLTQLSIQNSALRDELRQSKIKIFQLESDLDVLRKTIEDNLPYFNKMETQNKELQKQIQSLSIRNDIKDKDRYFQRIRSLEIQLKTAKEDADKQNRKLKIENQQLTERLDTVTKMNISIQKKMQFCQKKVDQYDNLMKKFKELEEQNVKLIELASREQFDVIKNTKIVCLPQFSQQDLQSNLQDLDETNQNYSIFELARSAQSKSSKDLSAKMKSEDEADFKSEQDAKLFVSSREVRKFNATPLMSYLVKSGKKNKNSDKKNLKSQTFIEHVSQPMTPVFDKKKFM